MSMEQILETVSSFDGVLVLAPKEGHGVPEIAWGDFFFYYAPDGQTPKNVQPYATIVTKNYPDDVESDLDPDGRWRVNIHVGKAKFTELTGENPRNFGPCDFAAADKIMPHPVYGSLGWVAVVNPGDRTLPSVVELLHAAHEEARRRFVRRRW
ncbi:DUF6194 family protein [Arthrobacter pigmenti]